ncbi:MAG: cation:proton antiporter [Lentisphaerae bacterium]|nr:cation:proton antiporter [Lentisphaerota bacterium]
MVVGLAGIILLGLLVDYCLRRIHVPGMIGLLVVGVVIGPYVLALLDPALLTVSADLRMIALIVILLRAGFALSTATLRRVWGRSALLACLPPLVEAGTITILGPLLLPLSTMESAMLGAILAAVSPAVVVTLMTDFMKRRKGTDQGLPTLLLAAAAMNDVVVIVIFGVLMGFYTGVQVHLVWQVVGIPLSILSGIGVGLGCGWGLYRLFHHFNPRATKRLLIVLGVAMALVALEPHLNSRIPFAALLAIMAMGTVILEKNETMAHEISAKLSKLWIFAEILLFTLVGAQVDIHVAMQAGLAGIALIAVGLLARSAGTYLCLLGSTFTQPERLFVVVAYLPKATVQAAIGGAPLLAMQAAGMGIAPGEVILAVAVLSIVLTAPGGAWLIARMGERILRDARP